MKNLRELKDLIATYDMMIDELVDNNASDKVIGNLELKRQKLISRCKKAEANNTSTIVEKKEGFQVTCQDEEKTNIVIEEYVEKATIVETLSDKIDIYNDILFGLQIDNDEKEIIKDFETKKEKLIDIVDKLVRAKEESDYIKVIQLILKL